MSFAPNQRTPDQAAAEYSRTNTLILLAVAAAVAVLHLLTNARYGLHRDELQFLSDAQHLDWGFVAYPPLTAFLERISLALFGLNLVGLRLFSVLAQCTAIVFTGLMARELGGHRLAQFTAAVSIALSALPLFEGTEFQYSTFDYLWWVLAAYGLIRLFKSQNPRWWLAIGAALGVGLQTKYSIVFFITGILGGLVLTRARRFFVNRWFYAGVALAILIFLPNLIWLARHDFISYHFLQRIHARDVRLGRTGGFLVDQIRICVNVCAAPLCLLGLIGFFRDSRYRPLAWAYLITFTLFFVGKGRGYYVAPAYPMLVAMGSAAGERWVLSLPALWRRTTIGIFFTGLVAIGLYICAILIPLASSGPLREFALARNGDLREELGWQQMVQSIAQVRDSLPPEQQAHLGIVVGNYGERGAIDLYGPAYHLPPAITGTNSGWLNSYPQTKPTTILILSVSDDDREQQFTGCKLAARIPYPNDQRNEESHHPEIYLCGPPRLPWPELWKIALNFG